ncbi:unnamed protein product [Caenorhabditis auriculariae]|uniref:Amino acid transporter transmembrane domain-containing protein n=1 Tax=Caenorhabditis auriculariae TaxID=2777116 RepID=A0A8S1HXD5_9PELO|nr:unnamed protein product [Caenorhabditis auriculariae]
MNGDANHRLLPSNGVPGQPLISNCYSEMFMSTGAVAPHQHGHKIGWVVAAIFIVADMVGGGVVAMPVAFKLSGLIPGVIFMVTIAIIFEYTGYQLGKVWCKMMERNPHIGVCRKPFPEMAKRTMGNMMQRFTSILGNVTLFGISVVYLLLSANIIHYFVTHVFDFHTMSNCMVIITLAVVILPFTFLRSPGEFWGVIVLAMITTVVAVLSILIGIGIDSPKCFPRVAYPETTPDSMILSLGIFLFAFSGHYVFPTIQHDMENPHEFSKSVLVGFIGVVFLYMPLSVFAYVVYGTSMYDSVIYSIQTQWLQLAANLMIAIHCIMTLVIVINPLNQELEHYLKISHSFGPGRVITRTVVMILVLFVGLTVPDFGPVMNLVGASTIPMGCVVLPSLFYLWCEAATEEEWRKGNYPTFKQVCQRTDKTVLIVNFMILLVAVGGGVLGTYQGLLKLAKASFSAPCYLRGWSGASYNGSFTIKNLCCGIHEDISVYNITNFCLKD